MYKYVCTHAVEIHLMRMSACALCAPDVCSLLGALVIYIHYALGGAYTKSTYYISTRAYERISDAVLWHDDDDGIEQNRWKCG